MPPTWPEAAAACRAARADSTVGAAREQADQSVAREQGGLQLKGPLAGARGSKPCGGSGLWVGIQDAPGEHVISSHCVPCWTLLGNGGGSTAFYRSGSGNCPLSEKCARRARGMNSC